MSVKTTNYSFDAKTHFGVKGSQAERVALLGFRGFSDFSFRGKLAAQLQCGISQMPSGYNVFEPEDLDLAQGILDEVWASLSDEARDDPQANLLRERLARQVLAAMSKENIGRDELKASLMRTDDIDQSDRLAPRR